MKALKTLVILMAIVIVAGFGFVVYTIVDRMLSGEPVLASRSTGPGEGMAVSDTSDPDTVGTETLGPDKLGRGAERLAGFGEIELAVPAGCELETARVEGRLLLVTLDGLLEQNCEQVVLFDLADGRQLGRVTLRPSQ